MANDRILDLIIRLTGADAASKKIGEIAVGGKKAADAFELANKQGDLFANALGGINPVMGQFVQQGQQLWKLMNGQLGPELTAQAIQMGVNADKAAQMGNMLAVAGKAAGIATALFAGYHLELKAINATMQSMSRGGTLLGGESAYRNVVGANSDALLRSLRGATDGTVDADTLRGIGLTGINADLTVQQLERITAASNDLSAAYKQDLVPLLQQHVPNAAAGAFRSLKQYGLGVEEIAVLEANATDKTEAYIQALEMLAKRAGPGADGAADAVDALKASQKEWNSELDKSIASLSESNGATALINSFAEALHRASAWTDVLVLGLSEMFRQTPPGWWLSLVGSGAQAWAQAGAQGEVGVIGVSGYSGGGRYTSKPYWNPMVSGYMSQDASGNQIWVPGADPVDRYNPNTSMIPPKLRGPKTDYRADLGMGQGAFNAWMEQLGAGIMNEEAVSYYNTLFAAQQRNSGNRTRNTRGATRGSGPGGYTRPGRGRVSQNIFMPSQNTVATDGTIPYRPNGGGTNLDEIALLAQAGMGGGFEGFANAGLSMVFSNTLSAASLLGPVAGPAVAGLLASGITGLFEKHQREQIRTPVPTTIENAEEITGPLNRTMMEAFRLFATGGSHRGELLAARQAVG